MENPFEKLVRKDGEPLIEEERAIDNNLADSERAQKANDKKEE